jgi:hypothetical protein
MADLPHLQPGNTSNKEPYQTPRSGGPKLKLPTRDRIHHGAALRTDLQRIQETQAAEDHDLTVVFDSEPGFELQLSSLDVRSQGIELLSVKKVDERELATVRVPRGKLQRFTTLVDEYLQRTTKSGQPKNRNLVESVSHIHLAVLESFWTDDPVEWPTGDNQPLWWEVWLRSGSDVLEGFRTNATAAGILVDDKSIVFPDRSVVLVRTSKNTFAATTQLFDYLAELRKPKDLASFFMQMAPAEARAWAL